MAHYTILNDTTVKNIFDQYDIGKILEYKLLSGGSENTNYRIKASKGDYVLTICEQKSETEATDLARLLVHLNENKFKTSQYIKGIITPDFSNQQMEILGKDLATLHDIEAPDFVPRNLGYGIEHFPEVQTHAPDAPFAKWLKPTTDYIQSFIQDDLPKALIHSDLFFNNIITEPQTGQVTIMDFEEATYYYRVYDLGMTLVGTCIFDRQLNLEKARHSTATAFWRFMNYNFVRPDETQKDRYKEMQEIAIHVMEIPAEKFLSLTMQ